jgi:hypothetical protein
MKAKTFAICDSIQDAPEGFDIQGARHEFFVPSLPGNSGNTFIPVHITSFPSENGKHTIRVSIKTASGVEAIDSYGLVVDFEDSFSFSFEHILQFPVAGNYIARLAVDGRQAVERPAASETAHSALLTLRCLTEISFQLGGFLKVQDIPNRSDNGACLDGANRQDRGENLSFARLRNKLDNFRVQLLEMLAAGSSSVALPAACTR